MATPTNRSTDSKQLFNSIMQGFNTPGRNGVGSSPFGAVAAFMGVPNLAGGPMRQGQYGGMDGIMDRFRQQQGIGQKKPTDPNAPKTGGDGPAVNPTDEAMLKAGLTPWWIDWRNQYGGAPPKGLLDV